MNIANVSNCVVLTPNRQADRQLHKKTQLQL